MSLGEYQISRKVRVVHGWFLLGVVTYFQAACAVSPLQEDLSNLCRLYKPESWSEVGKNTSIQDVYAFILKRQTQVVSDKEVVSILDNADTSSYANYFFSVKSSFKQLLGRDWACKAFDDFYLPEQSVVTFSLSGVSKKRIDPQSSNMLTIMLASNGTLLVNNNPLISSDTAVLKKALDRQLIQKSVKKINVVLYFDAGSDGGRVADFLSVMAEMGIQQVNIIQVE